MYAKWGLLFTYTIFLDWNSLLATWRILKNFVGKDFCISKVGFISNVSPFQALVRAFPGYSLIDFILAVQIWKQ